jgi:flagellar M-ring protein FliF
MEFFRQLIEGITAAWGKLNSSARVNIVLAAAAVIAAVVILVTWGGRPNYAVLYSNLSNDDVNEIVSELGTRQVPYQITSGGTAVRVPSSSVYELRNELAGQGLPRGGGVGFEIFDRQTLGVTPFQQKVNLQRALTTELARTITALDQVRNARVHLTLPEESLFAEEKKEPSAAVVLALTRPGALTKADVDGVLHVLAAGVEGLKRSNISVIDTQHNVLAAPTDDMDSAAGLTSKQLEAVKEQESYYKQKAKEALQKALGPRNFVVTVSAELDFDEVRTEEISHQEGALAREEISTETMLTKQALPRGPAGVTAGVVPGLAAATGATTTDKTSKQTTTEFEVPEKWQSTKKAPGTVKKLMVAALIERKYEMVESENGQKEKQYSESDADEIENLRNVVTAAVGLDETRGDLLTVSDMPFEEVPVAMELPGPPWYSGLPVAQMVLAAVALLAFMMLRSTLSKMVTAPVRVPAPEVAPAEEYEVSEEAVLKEKVKDEITRLSREQPDTVASVLRTWLVEE